MYVEIYKYVCTCPQSSCKRPVCEYVSKYICVSGASFSDNQDPPRLGLERGGIEGLTDGFNRKLIVLGGPIGLLCRTIQILKLVF